MKKILFIAHVQSHIINFHLPFLKYFNDKGYKVFVATKLDKKKYNNFREYEFIEWIDINYPRNPMSLNTFKAFRETVKLLKLYDFELIHTHTPVGGVLGRLANKFCKNNKILYTAHGFHFFKGAPKSYWLTYYPVEKVMSKFTDAIITMNDEDFENAKNKLLINPKDIYKVNGVGVDIEKFSNNGKVDLYFRKSLNIDEKDFVVTVVAELTKRKNQIQIINAMKYLKNECPNMKVLLVGDGDLYEFYKLEIIKSGLKENIKLLGYRKDVNKIIQMSDVVGLFSSQEGLPKNLLEALAAGKAIICTDVRGNNELVKNNKNGFLIELNNVNSTVDCLKRMYKNPEIIKRFEEKSKLIAKKYSEEKIINDMDKIYSKYIVD